MNLNELTLDNVGLWPWWAKALVLVLASVLLFVLFYFVDVKPYRMRILGAHLENQDLVRLYELKYTESVNLPLYDEQIVAMNKLIAARLAKLPKQIDLPNLIEDISKIGMSLGLTFRSIRPQTEVRHDFYTTLPIDITVLGSYHQFGRFAHHIAALRRIVTLDDFKITPVSASQNVDDVKAPSDQLMMQLVISAYRQSSPEPEKTKKVAAYSTGYHA